MVVRAVGAVSLALHRRTGPFATPDTHPLAEGHWFFTDHCLLSTALALCVLCSPMSMVSAWTRWPLIRFADTQRVYCLH